MIVKKKLVPALKKMLLTAAAVVVLMRCSEEELVTPAANQAEEGTLTAASAPAAASIASMTVSGVNTVFATAKDCSTCTFVVPEGTEIVDGKELGFAPGNVICLNSIFTYGNLEFVNIEGTEENPIVITTVDASATTTASDTQSTGDPY